MNTTARAALVLALSLLLSACGSAAGPGVENTPGGERTTVRVTNNNWADMVVYVVRSSMRVRIGTVTSMNTQNLQIPSSAVRGGSSVRLQISPIGSREQFLTPPIQVSPGQRIDFQIQNHLAISSVAVW